MPQAPTQEARPAGGARERILRAAMRLVGEAGLGAVTNRGVARSAGVSLGSLTYHFDTQDALLRESLLLFVDDEVARLRTLAERLADASLTEAEAAAGVQALVEQSSASRGHVAQVELYVEASRDPELRDAARRCFEAYDEVAVAALRAIGVRDPEAMAPALVALIDGLELRRLASGEVEDSGLADALLLLVRGGR